jgi:hypothetical protein
VGFYINTHHKAVENQETDDKPFLLSSREPGESSVLSVHCTGKASEEKSKVHLMHHFGPLFKQKEHKNFGCEKGRQKVLGRLFISGLSSSHSSLKSL